MCLAIPGQIKELFASNGLQMAKVNFGGIRKDACVEYVPEVKVGDFVLVHVGFAISVIDAQEAERAYSMLKASGEALDRELGTGVANEISG